MSVHETPLISVLMPVRNEERNVAAAVRSVLAQGHPVEVLVVDGASTDRTRTVLAELGDDRLRVLHNPARIIPAALNIGLRAARGTYVARVDAHHRIPDDYFDIALHTLAAQPDVAGVGGRRQGVAATDTGRAIVTALGSPFGVGNSINHYADVAQDTDHATCGVYRRSAVEQVGGWDENLLVNEDVDFDYRILQHGHRIWFDPTMTVSWQVREELPAFARQYRRYGRGKAGMVLKNGRAAVRARHLAAPLLVSWLGLAAVVGASGRRRLAVAMAAPYPVAVTCAAALTRHRARRADRPALLPLVTAFGTMHLAWGLGFLEGILLRRTPAAATVKESQTAGQVERPKGD